jgi:two-component system KDP operon response regulator KdpE
MEKTIADNQLVYVVDDDEVITSLVAINLTSQGYRVKQFHCGGELLESLNNDYPDLIILDVMMPGANGVEVAREIRRSSRVPIMMLSVYNDINTKATALNTGADDYLTKPFENEELLARVRAILRRSMPSGNGHCCTVYRCGELCVDLEGGLVTVRDRPVKLTPYEWGVLQVLVKHTGQVVESRYLLKEVWGPDYGEEGDYIRAYITRLRRKLESDPKHPRYILLERGFGYRMADPDGTVQTRRDGNPPGV